MSGYENVLPARSKVIDPSSGDIVVDQKLALVRPALRVSGGFGMPSLFAPARFVCVCCNNSGPVVGVRRHAIQPFVKHAKVIKENKKKIRTRSDC